MGRKQAKSIPKYKRKRQSSGALRRVVRGIAKLLMLLVVLSVLWVLAYRFVNPPITATMLSDIVSGRGANRAWIPIARIDRDMVRAAIAGEDAKYCTHSGFDFKAIEDAARRNASGGRIRGGSTISQQAAKNAFLWQGGGYARKGLEAWFTFLAEQLWGKRRIMEIYLNIAETGLGTYGVNAGSQRYFGHDASAMSPIEAARLAAVLPLPKQRGAVAPVGFTRRYGATIASRIGIVARDGLDACVYAGTTPPVNKAPPVRHETRRALPGSEYETKAPPPPAPDVDQPAPPPATTAAEPVADAAPDQSSGPATNAASTTPINAE